MNAEDAGTLADRPSPMMVTWNWVDAYACDVKSRSATPADARAALKRAAKTEPRLGRQQVVGHRADCEVSA